MKNLFYFIFSILFLIVIFLFPQSTFEGANSGLNLWLFTVIPTLLPFLIITEILREINGLSLISKFPSRFLSPLLRISRISSYAIITGLLCGYPLGAKATCDLLKDKKISQKEASYLISFTGNPSPIFLITYIFTKNLYSDTYKLPCIFALYSSILLTALILRCFYSFAYTPESFSKNNLYTPKGIIDNSIYDSFNILLKIGGYIILFSIFASIIKTFFRTNLFLCSFITGIFEMTNGIRELSTCYINEKIKAIAMCSIASLGGLSTLMQTKSIICEYNLSILNYILGKLVSTTLMIIIFFLIT